MERKNGKPQSQSQNREFYKSARKKRLLHTPPFSERPGRFFNAIFQKNHLILQKDASCGILEK
jgi:hypothetical protein